MDRRKFINTTALAGGAMVAAPSILSASVSSSSCIQIKPRWDEKGSALRHTWAGLGNVDQMRWILRRDMQEQLAMCHKEIGLRHVRAVGIFDDEMWVFDKDPANFLNSEKRNAKRYNWRVPYYIYDSLVEMGIAPMVTTCFTPGEMRSAEQTAFSTKSHISPPRDWKEWGNFVTSFVRGLVNRYGINVIRNWYFEVWNEPNLTSFYTGKLEDYLKLYEVVYGAVKSVDASLKVGGPSTAHTVWLTELLNYGVQHNCMPDYIIGHIYNNDSAAGDPLSPFDGPQSDKENKSPNFVSGITRGARKLLDEASFKGELHMNEWGLSWHPYAPVRETANEAAFIVKTMNEVSQLADYFAYWCLSDIYNQVGYGREAFHGNYGMISLDGLRKPNYFAHQLLCMLGNEQIPFSSTGTDSQTNVLVSRKNNVLQVLAYAFDIHYQAGNATGNCEITIELPVDVNINSARIFRVDSKNNNILHSWNEMGSPAYPNRQEVDQLFTVNNLRSEPYRGSTTKGQNGPVIKLNFETPGILFVEIPLK